MRTGRPLCGCRGSTSEVPQQCILASYRQTPHYNLSNEPTRLEFKQTCSRFLVLIGVASEVAEPRSDSRPTDIALELFCT